MKEQIRNIQDAFNGTNADSPDFIKTASKYTDAVTPDDYNEMSEDDFAIVFLTKEGHHIPKYPVHNAMHTWDSLDSFDKTAHLLPAPARVMVATFIKKACDQYGIEPPVYVGDISDKNIDSNIYDMAANHTVNIPSVSKTAAILLSDDMVKEAKDQVLKAHQSDMPSGSFALSGNRYPIYSSELVKEANDFFASHNEKLHPKERREFSVKLASKARKYGIELDECIQKYAGKNYADDLEAQIEVRKWQSTDEAHSALYDALYEKRAHISPDNFSEILLELDEATGLDELWDAKIPDPYYTTTKQASDPMNSYVFDYGDGTVSGLQIGKLGEDPTVLSGYLAPEIVATFSKQPLMVFQSLPRPHKMIMVKAIKGDLEVRINETDDELEDAVMEDEESKKNEKYNQGKEAAMITDPPIAKGPIKSLSGGKALEKVFPDGPAVMGVKQPSSRLQSKLAFRAAREEGSELRPGKVDSNGRWVNNKTAALQSYIDGRDGAKSTVGEHAARVGRRLGELGLAFGAGAGYMRNPNSRLAAMIGSGLSMGLVTGALGAGAGGAANLIGKAERKLS